MINEYWNAKDILGYNTFLYGSFERNASDLGKNSIPIPFCGKPTQGNVESDESTKNKTTII
jgi:hypothetical protein